MIKVEFMYHIAIPATLMALAFLALLYVLFTMGLRENLSPPVNTLPPHVNDPKDCTIDGRVAMMVVAWNDTIQSPQKIEMDANVFYKLWSSNVLRRGLDKIYTDPALFTRLMMLSKNGELTVPAVRELIAPYYQQETAPPNVTMPLVPFCHAP